MQSKPAHGMHHRAYHVAHRVAGRIPVKKIIAAVVVLLILYGVYLALQPSALTITAAKTLSLSPNQTVFLRIYNGSTTALTLRTASASGATFYVARLPVLYGAVSSVTLAPAGGANVSSNATQTADMNIKLVSVTSTGATVIVSPLFAVLGIKPSASVVLLWPVTLGTVSKTPNGTATSISTSTSTASSASTVATNTTAALYQQALTLINQTNIGILMKNFKALYNKVPSCTSTLYNQSYQTYNHNHVLPPPPVYFVNVSPYTPTDIKITTSNATKKNNVLITYSTVAPSSLSSGAAVLAVVNASAISFLSNVSYIGVYRGLNYSKLNASYNFEKTIPNACAALIPQ